MPSTTKDEDRYIAKTARAAAARINLDISELQITCGNGNIDMIGKIRAPRGATGSVSVRKEFQSMLNVIRNVRGVRDVQSSRVILFD